MGVLERTFFGNTLQAWLIAAATFAVVLGGLLILNRLVDRRLVRITKRTRTRADDVALGALRSTKAAFLLLVALAAASLALSLPAESVTVRGKVLIIAFVIQAVVWGSGGLRAWIADYRERTLDVDAASVTTMTALSFVGRLVLWVIALLLILDNLAVDITALVTGLGIGGIAVALAVQNILGDLFASLSIVMDKPFVIGDFLNVDGYMGRVEHIGLKTTRVRSLSGEQLVFSNGDLLKSRIRNFGRMYERRVVFTLGVTYDTPNGKVERIPAMVREIVEAEEFTRFDRCHFKEYGDFALIIETVYFMLKADFNLYMDTQERINLEVRRCFEREGIEFAYPTRTVYYQALDGSRAADRIPAAG